MMLTACSPSKEDKTKENGASAASSTASAASSSAPQTDLQPAASAPDNVKQAESVPPSNCTDLHPATGIDDLMQQIAEHIDSDCLFALSHHELETRFGLPGGGYDNIQRLLFPTSALKIPTTIRKSYWQLKTCVTESARSAGRHKMP